MVCLPLTLARALLESNLGRLPNVLALELLVLNNNATRVSYRKRCSREASVAGRAISLPLSRLYGTV